MKYFSYISNSYSLKNSLEKAIYAVLCDINRQVIDETEVEAFQRNITEQVEHLNKAFHRCKPCRIEWWAPRYSKDDKDFHLQLGGGICNFHLYATKN